MNEEQIIKEIEKALDVNSETAKQRGAFEIVLTYAGFFNEKSQVPKKGSTEFF